MMLLAALAVSFVSASIEKLKTGSQLLVHSAAGQRISQLPIVLELSQQVLQSIDQLEEFPRDIKIALTTQLLTICWQADMKGKLADFGNSIETKSSNLESTRDQVLSSLTTVPCKLFPLIKLVDGVADKDTAKLRKAVDEVIAVVQSVSLRNRVFRGSKQKIKRAAFSCSEQLVASLVSQAEVVARQVFDHAGTLSGASLRAFVQKLAGLLRMTILIGTRYYSGLWTGRLVARESLKSVEQFFIALNAAIAESLKYALQQMSASEDVQSRWAALYSLLGDLTRETREKQLSLRLATLVVDFAESVSD